MKKILFLMSAWLFASQTYAANICEGYAQYCRYDGAYRSLDIRNLNGNVKTLSAILRRVVDPNTVTTLYLSNNQLQALPVEIGNLVALTYLDLSNNQLQALPREIGNLWVLTTLYLGNNQLQVLPGEIGNLRLLSLLDLSHNQLESLPVEIENLRDLTMLYLDHNTPNTDTGSRTKRVACTSELEATEATEAYLPCMDEPVRPDDVVQPHKEDSTVANPNAYQSQAEHETGYQLLSLGLDISEDIELLEALGVEIAPCHE